jgi:predicted AlkP superfamily pyrophosphatase or phosphodiesterase
VKKILFIFILVPVIAFSQEKKPKLVIGIVVDQMRYDYISRFWNKYSDGGFKKLVNNGVNCTNTHFNYMPTYTGPGHASIYTGTTPENHGIIANDWYDKKYKTYQYCVGDSSYKTVGSSSTNGQMSPQNLISTTITDELKLATNNKGKVIGISIKDRGAILPAGHRADAAYWFDGDDVGQWVSSSFYGETLPKWLIQINEKNPAEQYLSQQWNTLLPIKNYTESLADNNPYEGVFNEEDAPVFPHNLPVLRDSNSNYSLIKATPFGNTILKELALTVLKEEKLGKDEYTDFLSISFSSTDYIGHKYGPLSIELEDTYLRLDKDLEELLIYIEENYAKEDVLIFLTADHGAVHVPQYLIDNNLPGGYFDVGEMYKELQKILFETYRKDSLIASVSNAQIFLNQHLISQHNLSVADVENTISQFLLTKKGISKVVTATSLKASQFSDRILANVQRGFHHARSGDILYVLESGWIHAGYPTGTTHGSPYNYDTHVPLIWYGAGIKKGEVNKKVAITDISATIAAFLNIQMPSACTGKPISKIIK